jgi:hypothetical protein
VKPTRSIRPLIQSLILASAVVALPTAAFAGNSHGTTVASIALASSGTQAASTQPALGQAVAFATTVPNTDKSPAIVVNCYQNGTLVWGEVGSVSASYKLGGDSSPWLTNGGTASCDAQLVNITWHAGTESISQLASTSFAASA